MGVGVALIGVGVALMGLRRPELVMESIVPVVMAGVLRIYGLIISTGINPKAKPYFLFDVYAHLTSGLACGLAGLAAGMSIGIVGDAGVRMWMAKCCRILVPYDDVGRIIGKAGSSIAAIEAGSSAHIKLTGRGQLLPGTKYLNLHTTLLQQFGLHIQQQ